jgi:hypothetical protein
VLIKGIYSHIEEPIAPILNSPIEQPVLGKKKKKKNKEIEKKPEMMTNQCCCRII